MLKHIKTIWQKAIGTEERKRLFGNIASLGILQGLNYLLPMITFPYQVRVLGTDKYGLLAFASATIAYFQILVDYGFNLTGPREIAIHRDNKEKLSEIVSSVIQIKLGLFIIAAFLLVFIVSFVNRFRQDALVYYITFITIFGQILFPVWFFQGMERMKYITIFNVIARTIFTALIFVFVRQEADYYKVPLLSAIGSFIAGIGSLYVMRRSFGIKFKWQRKSILSHYFKESFSIFISSFAVSMYTSSTTFILGFFASNTEIGYYAAANKIIQIVKSLLSPITQSLYPFISKKIHEDKENGIIIIRKLLKYIALATFFFSCLLFLAAPPLIHFLMGDQYLQSVTPLRIMAFLPFIIALSNIFGIQTMLPFGRNKAFSRIIIVGSLMNIALSFLFVPWLKYVGSAISVTIVESFITLSMFLYLQKEGFNIISIRK